MTNSTAIAKTKKRWERAELFLEIVSVLGGLLVGVGLWLEGETTIGQRLVIGGVAIEVFAAWWVLVASRKLQNALESELEILRLKAAQLNEHAEQSKHETAKMALQLQAARKDTVTLANEILELERVLRVRRYIPIVR